MNAPAAHDRFRGAGRREVDGEVDAAGEIPGLHRSCHVEQRERRSPGRRARRRGRAARELAPTGRFGRPDERICIAVLPCGRPSALAARLSGATAVPIANRLRPAQYERDRQGGAKLRNRR
jgi:hypothetical protein